MKKKKRVFVPFAHTRAYIKSKSSRIGDMWTDRENFIALMKAMGYEKFHNHISFLDKRREWDNLVVHRRRNLAVPRRYFDYIGVEEKELVRRVKQDQEEYLEALKRAVPEHFEVGYWIVTFGGKELPPGMSEEEALDYVLGYIRERHPEKMRMDRFWAVLVFSDGVKTIDIGKNLKHFVSYNYPDMEVRKDHYTFLLRRSLPKK